MSDKKSKSKGDQTRALIKQAIIRVKNKRPKIIAKNRKISIASIAEEADVSRATIHNRHPDLAEEIRELDNKAVRKQRDKKQSDLNVEKSKGKDLRQELSELKTTLIKVLSENATLTLRNRQLESMLHSDNVTPINS